MRTLVPALFILLIAANAVRASFVFENVADTSSISPFQQVTNCSVGANGYVAFQATLKSGASGIYAYKNAQLITTADTTQGYSSFGTIPAVNAHGDVAFTAKLPDGS